MNNKKDDDMYLHHKDLKHKEEKKGELHNEKEKPIEGVHHVKNENDKVTQGLEEHEVFYPNADK
jgi:hypothetical protein